MNSLFEGDIDFEETEQLNGMSVYNCNGLVIYILCYDLMMAYDDLELAPA